MGDQDREYKNRRIMSVHVFARAGGLRLRVVASRKVPRTQRRKMGDGPFTDAMHVKKNKFVEEWNGRREITEKAFEVNMDNLPTLILTCVVIPYGIYYFTRKEIMIKGDPRFKRSGVA